MRLWEKAQKNARNSLHSITIGSSTLGKRALFIWLKMAAVQRVENDDAGKNYDPSSFKNSCPSTKTSYHIESDSVKAFHDALNDGLRVLGNDDIVLKEGEWVRLIIMQPIKGLFSHAFSQSLTIPPQRIAGSGYEIGN